MKENNMPIEIKELLPSIKLSEKMYLLLWKKNSDFLKENTLEYNINAIYNFLEKNESKW